MSAAPQPDWLAQLAPAHAPPPPAWWPPAPGWWLLVVLIVLVVLLMSAAIYRWCHPQRRLRRAALLELQQLQARNAEDHVLAGALENLLRRFAVASYGVEVVARLSGEAWIAFVIERGGAAWADGAGSALLSLAYGGNAPAQRERWLEAARGFIRNRPPEAVSAAVGARTRQSFRSPLSGCSRRFAWVRSR